MVQCPSCGNSVAADFGMVVCPKCKNFIVLDVEGNVQEGEVISSSMPQENEVEESAEIPVAPPLEMGGDVPETYESPSEEPASQLQTEVFESFSEPEDLEEIDADPAVDNSAETIVFDENRPFVGDTEEAEVEGEEEASEEGEVEYEEEFEEGDEEEEYETVEEEEVSGATVVVSGPQADPEGKTWVIDSSETDYAPEDLSEIEDYGNSEVSVGKDGQVLYDLRISGIDSADIKKLVEENISDRRLALNVKGLFKTIDSGVLEIKRVNAVKTSIIVNRLKSLPVSIHWRQNVITQVDPD